MIFSTIFILRHHSQRVWLFLLFLFFSCLQSEGWPHHGRTFSIYLCPMSFWSILPRGVLSTYWCCPSQKWQDVFLHSFWMSSFHSRTLLLPTLALSLAVSSLKSVCCDFSTFSARDPRYGNGSSCSSCSFWMSMRHTMPLLAITLVLSTLMSRLCLWLTRSRQYTISCSSDSEVANSMMSSALVGWLEFIGN